MTPEQKYFNWVITLVFVGSCYSSFSFQCSVVCSMFVFLFILLAMVLSVFRLNDFCLPLWYLRIPFPDSIGIVLTEGTPLQLSKEKLLRNYHFLAFPGTKTPSAKVDKIFLVKSRYHYIVLRQMTLRNYMHPSFSYVGICC